MEWWHWIIVMVSVGFAAFTAGWVMGDLKASDRELYQRVHLRRQLRDARDQLERYAEIQELEQAWQQTWDAEAGK